MQNIELTGKLKNIIAIRGNNDYNIRLGTRSYKSSVTGDKTGWGLYENIIFAMTLRLERVISNKLWRGDIYIKFNGGSENE